MPHYKDGTEAKVGDQVFGKLYNTEGIRCGTIISITPGQDVCNAMVQFTFARMVTAGIESAPPRTASLVTVRRVKGEGHGTAGADFDLFTCADYSQINQLTKVE